MHPQASLLATTALHVADSSTLTLCFALYLRAAAAQGHIIGALRKYLIPASDA